LAARAAASSSTIAVSTALMRRGYTLHPVQRDETKRETERANILGTEPLMGAPRGRLHGDIQGAVSRYHEWLRVGGGPPRCDDYAHQVLDVGAEIDAPETRRVSKCEPHLLPNSRSQARNLHQRSLASPRKRPRRRSFDGPEPSELNSGI